MRGMQLFRALVKEADNSKYHDQPDGKKHRGDRYHKKQVNRLPFVFP
jgi:hypothetical protein